MQADMSAGPRDCSAGFRKRRNRLILIAFPLAAAMMIAWEAANDLDFQIYGLDHDQTLWLGIGAAVVLFGLNLIDWRCPNCNTYLNNGISIPFCKSCGALFVPPPADKAVMSQAEVDPQVAAAVRRAQAEAALQSEINEYRGQCVQMILKVLVIFGLGALMVFVLAPPADPVSATRARLFGWGVMVLAAAWIAWEVRSMSKAKQRITEKYRDLLGLES